MKTPETILKDREEKNGQNNEIYSQEFASIVIPNDAKIIYEHGKKAEKNVNFFGFFHKAKTEENSIAVELIERVPVDWLPMEIWVKIFAYFSIKELLKSTLVSKKFNDLINILPIWLEQVHSITLNKISKYQERERQAKQIYLSNHNQIVKKQQGIFGHSINEIMESAVCNSDIEILRQLFLQKKVSVNFLIHHVPTWESQVYSITVLALACKKEQIELVKFLLSWRPDLTQQSSQTSGNQHGNWTHQYSVFAYAEKPEIRALLHLGCMEDAIHKMSQIKSEAADAKNKFLLAAKQSLTRSFSANAEIVNEYIVELNATLKGFAISFSPFGVKLLKEWYEEIANKAVVSKINTSP